jgi:hypothetical protein
MPQLPGRNRKSRREEPAEQAFHLKQAFQSIRIERIARGAALGPQLQSVRIVGDLHGAHDAILVRGQAALHRAFAIAAYEFGRPSQTLDEVSDLRENVLDLGKHGRLTSLAENSK